MILYLWALFFLVELKTIQVYKPYIYIYKIIGKVERNSNWNSKLEFQFCAMCPKLFILKEFCFLILESNMRPHHKYSSKWVIKYKNQRV